MEQCRGGAERCTVVRGSSVHGAWHCGHSELLYGRASGAARPPVCRGAAGGEGRPGGLQLGKHGAGGGEQCTQGVVRGSGVVRRDVASRMSGASVDQAVRLVRQAVLQDSKRNYGEAARCYRDAIVTFKELRHSRSSSHRLQTLLDTKLGGFPAQIGASSFPCQIWYFNTFLN